MKFGIVRNNYIADKHKENWGKIQKGMWKS